MTGVRAEAAALPVQPVAAAFLASINSTFDYYGVALPESQVITVGSVAVENTSILAVMFGGLSVGLPGTDMSAGPVSYDKPRTIVLNVELWRTAPGLDSPHAPSDATISKHAGPPMDDAWILLEAAYAFDSTNDGRGILASVSASETEGGSHGVTMTVSMQVP